jgi:hypothetical protein
MDKGTRKMTYLMKVIPYGLFLFKLICVKIVLLSYRFMKLGFVMPFILFM